MVCLSLLILAVASHRLRPGRIAPLGGDELMRIRRFSDRQQSNESIPYV